MTRTLLQLSKSALLLAAVATCLATAPAPAQAQVEVRISPPAWYIATTRPTYYEGHPSYWYRNQWHYREGRSWRTYRDEPRGLREYRNRYERNRHFYGRDHGGGYGRGRWDDRG